MEFTYKRFYGPIFSLTLLRNVSFKFLYGLVRVILFKFLAVKESTGCVHRVKEPVKPLLILSRKFLLGTLSTLFHRNPTTIGLFLKLLALPFTDFSYLCFLALLKELFLRLLETTQIKSFGNRCKLLTHNCLTFVSTNITISLYFSIPYLILLILPPSLTILFRSSM